MKGSPRSWICCSHRERKERSVIIYYMPGFLPDLCALPASQQPKMGPRSHSIPDEKLHRWEVT